VQNCSDWLARVLKMELDAALMKDQRQTTVMH
jgi:hypothetical protein